MFSSSPGLPCTHEKEPALPCLFFLRVCGEGLGTRLPYANAANVAVVYNIILYTTRFLQNPTIVRHVDQPDVGDGHDTTLLRLVSLLGVVPAWVLHTWNQDTHTHVLILVSDNCGQSIKHSYFHWVQEHQLLVDIE